MTVCFRACPPAQSKHSKHALQPMLCPPPRVEDLSYLRASKKSDKHPYHPARVGESYQATLPAWEAPAASCEGLPAPSCEGLPSPAAVEAAAAGCAPPPPRASKESTVQPGTGAARALAGTSTTAAGLHGPARAPVPAASSVSSMLPGCSGPTRDVPPPPSAPVSASAPVAASARAPVLAAAARSSAALPFAVVVPRGKAAKQAAAAAGEERRWAATIASAEAVELELEALPPPPSKPASPRPCRSPATQSAPLGADCSSSPQRKRARVGSPCFDLSNLS